ncbi:MAG: cytochrome c3 family protein [Deltaproteobacteria bacterium]|nr:cytochrome c3 family protein [Deltaproteobacteria bacterium]
MSNKFFTLLMVGLTAILFLTAGILTAANVPVPDVVVIENKYDKDKKPPVKLTHNKHVSEYKVSCEECHHDYQDGKNVWKEGDEVKKCSACHNPLKDEGKVVKLQNAFHQNCKDCHKEKNAPFKKCTECHKK